MDLSTEEFILFYKNAVHKKASQISPILVSPFTSSQDTIQIQVIPTTKATLKDEKIDYPSCKIIKDQNCFYQIRNQNLMTLVQKISDNRCVWNIPAFFPAKFVAASLSRDLLFIGLSDKTINVLDTNTGVCCFPSVFVDDKIIFLISEENYLICFTSNNMLMVWEIVNSKYLRSIIHEKYEGPKLGDIQKVILTNELENDSISPMIFAENITVRFSKTRNGWINAKCKVPPFFAKPAEYRTIYDVEKGFFESLINDEFEKFRNCMTILLQKYLKSKHNKRVIKLVNQLLDIIREGKAVYCGMNPKELLEFMLNLIGETNPEIVDIIRQSQEYADAFNPKQPTPRHNIQPNNQNISPEQQEVIDILYKSQPNNQSPSMVTHLIIPTSESQNQIQGGSFNWPILNTQPSNQTTELPIQEPQVEFNEKPSVQNSSIITPPQTFDQLSQATEIISSKVKSYNEDDGLTRAQKYISESLPTPPVNKIPSPIKQETTKKNNQAVAIPALNIVSTGEDQAPAQKSPANSPKRNAKRPIMKQGTLDFFIKTPQKKKETTNVEETKSNNQLIIQEPTQSNATASEDKDVDQNLNDEENTQQQSTTQQRRSPRVSKKADVDQSLETKKKATKATPKKKTAKAKKSQNENEQQQEQEDNTNQQEIPESTNNKKTPKKANIKKNPLINLMENNPFQEEDESASSASSQSSLPVNNIYSDDNQFSQPIPNPEQPNPLIFNDANHQSQQIHVPLMQPNQLYLNPQALKELLSPKEFKLFQNPNAQNTVGFKKLDPKSQNLLIQFQMQQNITPKRNPKANTKNLTQTTQVAEIQSQPNLITQQQSAEINDSNLKLQDLGQLNENNNEPENMGKKKKATPRKKAATSKSKKNNDQQQEQDNVIPQDEFITSIISGNNEQENAPNSSVTLKKPKTRGKKANSKSQESENNENNDQKQEKKKSTTRQKKQKDVKSISQAPILTIQNDDEKLTVPNLIDQNKLTIEEAQELADKMQQEDE